ncbi:hypothetical protein BD410DRAFT_769877 [Rickenella mellea]|uniref:UBA domain-containing protein n=1 Tax=Rickenella mellea TaxID=50990 RepID=A0A4Y7Q7H1_9AGAM|nr:hypothetical protein BD410DRAFT_769877 [Rickenella mellea]
MSDAFADLWNSTAPSKPSAPPQTLATATRATRATPKHDVFSMLASTPSTSQPNSRPITPSLAQLSGQGQPIGQQKSGTGSSTSTGDAFSDLLGGSLSAGKSGNAMMSIAQRQAAVERERKERDAGRRQVVPQETQVWDGLDKFASSGTTQTKPPASQAHDNDWIFDSLTSSAKNASGASTTTPKATGRDDDGWGLSDFASTSTTSTSTVNTSRPNPNGSQSSSDHRPPASLFDALDDIASPAPVDDILGVLSKPPQRPASPLTNQSQTPPPRRPASSTTNNDNGNNRTQYSASPPPHIIGQIVEMGFAPQQARIALAATDTGVNVQEALEILMASADDGGDGEVGGDDGVERESARGASPGGRLHESLLDQDAPAVHSNSKRRRPAAHAPSMPARQLSTGSTASSSSRHDPTPSSASASNSTTATGAGGTAPDLQDRADKLLAQASEIGMSMFSRANAFWREGKEKVVKVYEERAVGGAATSSAAAATTPQRRGTPTGDVGGKIRPKWMMETSGALGVDDEDAGGVVGGFQDDEEDHDAQGGDGGGSAFLVAPVAQKNVNRASPPAARSMSTSGSLFADEPSTYVSPSRRRTPTPTTPPLTSATAPTKSSSSSFRSPSPAPPPTLRIRPTISAPAHVIATSNKHKLAGNEMFKLGRYAEADTLYTQAMASLPSGHLLLVPLHNNRAATRLKTGDHVGSADDCTAVLALIGADDGSGGSFHPTRERKVQREEDWGGVDLGEAVVKAYKRRAEAREARERWDEARKDWERLASVEWAGARVSGDAVANAGRCRKMVRASTEATPPKPRAPPRRGPLASSSSSQTFDAVLKLRSANKAQDDEDLARHELKDVVDAKLTAWKGGKENNLRALIASLDSVLWPALAWQKVGMAELVTNAQVKVRYTKAIAKLHPDKLNSSNTTLEQRMTANGVFSALNDAWNVFKQ